MAAGFEGLSVSKLGISLLTPTFGMVGLSVPKIEGQYFAPLFGFSGLLVNSQPDKIRPLKKTIKHF